ncbi:MAG: hypothetical protein Q9220_003694 [cf. Caloplaca sp. 1 TL-2023]
MAPESTVLTTRVTSGSPYQLDKSQTLKASSALIKHINTISDSKEAGAATKNLLKATSDQSDDDTSLDAEPVWLVTTTKKHIAQQHRLKPGKIPLPHSLNKSNTVSICLITCDPQRQIKDTIAHPSFPTSLSARITKIIGISKLKARYHPFENKRKLRDEHDIFLADARVVTMLPKILGKVFYKGTKKPVPVNLEPSREKDSAGKRVANKSTTEGVKPIAAPLQVAKEIEKAIGCTFVHLAPSNNVSIRIGRSTFTAQQVAENVEAVVPELVEKFIPKGWRNVRAIHIKGANTMALPIWLADELWVDEKDVLKEEDAQEQKSIEGRAGTKKRKSALNAVRGEDDGQENKRERGEEDEKGAKKKRKTEEVDLSKEMRERREKLREQKRLDRQAMQEA